MEGECAIKCITVVSSCSAKDSLAVSTFRGFLLAG